MAKKEKKESRERKEDVLIDVKFTQKNFLLFAAGLISIIVGFILLRNGDITLAPILLVLGYLVFFPLGILLK
ncbi:MAG: hypothetical protein ABIL70_08725 [candidate division WOR-3 bacterium]